MRRLVAIAFIAFAFGCSSASSKNADPNANPNNQADGGNNGVDASGRDTSSSSGCGESPSDLSGTCTDGQQCEYRTDPREGCGSIATCEGGQWGSVEIGDCIPLPAVTCPATRDDAAGELCDPLDAYCDYDGLVCHCTNCVDGPVGTQCTGDIVWMCAPPNPDSACPPAKPQLGAGCDDDNRACSYACGSGGGRTCTAGSWQASDGGPCPVSTVKVKRDIRYLSPAELREVSKAVQAIPLAHWQYNDPAFGRGEKLGFIIEDLPAATPAVDRDRLMVDLYGYTSMLVADAQARELRMRSLEARLAELETLQCAQ